ncbi:MAG: SDR family NAD(P)-dependent oxidoreductase [Pseudomonadota bacterium]
MATALITGANRGIGAALRAEGTARGHKIIGTHRGEAAPGWITLDVTSPESFCDAAGALAEPIDLLVCNAGVYLDKGVPLHGITAEMLNKTFEANVTGVLLTVQAFLPHLMKSDGPRRIAIISSIMGSQARAPGGAYAYRASKAAAANLGRNLAADLAGDGVSVGIYHPGWVQTDMGGAEAAITVDESAKGLWDRFDAIAPDTTGAFLNYDGSAVPF